MPAVPFTHAGYKPQPLPAGIYAPIPTPFKTDGSEDLDTDALVRHAKRLAAAGIGLVVSGSTGEAVAMTHAERAQAVYAIRAASPTVPIIAGTGGGSLRETIVFCHEAAAAGADAAIVIAPGYFSASIAQDRKALKEFFCETADKSPVPVMVYNFPAAAGGIDLDSELLEEIAEHPNICGAKLTCAGVGKGGRLANSKHVKGQNRVFHVFPGYADIILPCMTIGMTGAIVGTANVVPRVCAAHYTDVATFLKSPSSPLLARITQTQDILSRADRALAKSGVVSTKWAVEKWYYPMGIARKPLQPVSAQTQTTLAVELQTVLGMERQLEQAAGVATDAQKS